MKRNATSTTGLSQASAGADTSVGRGCLLLSRRDVAGPHSHRMSRHRPGSALILVLVCLVMMVLIGTAYIQVARVDRRATAQLTGVNNLDTVRDAVIAYMQKVLKEDIFDDAGKMFNPASFDEPYDHAWTNRAVTYPVHSSLPATLGNVIGSAAGGQNDDTWLAATYMSPEVPANGVRSLWNKLSNLNGIYLVMPSSTGAANPEERVVEANRDYGTGGTPATNGVLRYDGYGEVYVNVAAYGDNDKYSVYSEPVGGAGLFFTLDYSGQTASQPFGVDADGDGILDSAWTWAPEEVRQIGALTYVVAYRIIDLSSLANVNIATGLSSNGATMPTQMQAPRGAYPTDLDLSRLFAKSNKGAAWAAEFGAVMATRGLSNTFPTMPGVATFSDTTGLATYTGTGHRAAAWNDASIGAKYYGYTNNRYDMESELELRARGGLNTATVAPIETSMPGLLRSTADPAVEIAVRNVAGLASPTNDHGNNSYMNGSIRGINGGYGLDNAARTYPALRHFITTSSGASILAPQYTTNWTQGASSIDRLQYDLVYRNVSTPNPTARAQEIADRLKKIFNIGTPLYLGLSATQVDQVATEFALAIQDYSDADSTPTALAVGGTTYYGLEIMPFLREFYVQAAYESTMPDTAAMPPVYKERTLVPGSGAFVIEIGNPFDKNCSFAGASIRVRIVKEGSTTAIVQYDVPSTVNELPPRDNTEVTEQLIFYSTPATPTADGLGKGSDLLADLSLNTAYANAARRVEIPAKLPDSAFDESPLTVELQVEVSEGVFVTYDRLRAPEMKLPNKYTQNHGDATTPEKGHSQISLMRDGQKNRYLSNRGRVVKKSDAGLNTYVGNDSTVSKLGKDNKTVAGDANIDKMQLAHSDHQIFNVAELGYIFMYGYFDGDEGDLPSRISGKDGSKGPGTTTVATETASRGRMFLSLNASGAIVDASNPAIIPSTTKLPHFSMVMDQFTTLSPRWDGVDNDNDDGDNNVNSSVDNDAEQFVPGRMNVNTTPTWLLAMMSPLPETLADLEQYYQAIGEYRDRPASRPVITGIATGLPIVNNSDKGIRSLGELLLIKRRISTQSDNQKTFRYGEDTGYLASTDLKRHYPHIDDDTATVYDEEYSAQERMARFQYLSNTLTTRSDRFCAYVVIRGYNSGAFNTAPAESLRFFVMLDRSGLIDVDSTVTAYPRTGQKN